MKEVRPTAFFGVPRVWEKIQEKMVAVGRTRGFISRWIVSWAKYVGLSGSISAMNGYAGFAYESCLNMFIVIIFAGCYV